MEKVITVTANAAIDKTLIMRNLKLGKVAFSKKTYIYPSGKGINVSRALRILGIETLATGFLGGFTGKFIESELRKENISTDFVFVEGETRINATLIDTENKTETHIVEEGYHVNREDINKLTRKFTSLVKGFQFASFCGSLPVGAHDELYAEMIEISKKFGVITLLDTREEPLIKAIEKKPDIIKPNKKELSEIVNKEIKDMAGIVASIEELLSYGIKMVFVTLGEEGSIGADGSNIYRAIPPKVKVVNTRACGDAFAAGVIFSIIKRYNFGDTVRMATACGCANSIVDGPCYITLKDVLEIYNKTALERL